MKLAGVWRARNSQHLGSTRRQRARPIKQADSLKIWIEHVAAVQGKPSAAAFKGSSGAERR